MRPADVAQPASPVGGVRVLDEGHQAPVGELGHQAGGQPADALGGVERRGEGLRHRRQQREAVRGAVQRLLGVAAGGDVDEVDGEALGGGPGAHLVPGVQRRRVPGLEGHRLARRDGAPVVLLEGTAHGGGERVPDAGADQVDARRAEQPLGLGVDVGEAPLAVELEERRRHRLEHATHAGLALAHLGGVVRRSDQADGRTVGLVGEGVAARLDPPQGPVGQDHAVLRGVVTAGGDGALEGVRDASDVVGVHAAAEGLDRPAEALLVEAEQLVEPLVQAEVAGHQVPDERTDAGGVDGEPPREAVALRVEDGPRGRRRGVVVGHRSFSCQLMPGRRPTVLEARAQGVTREGAAPPNDATSGPAVDDLRGGREVLDVRSRR